MPLEKRFVPPPKKSSLPPIRLSIKLKTAHWGKPKICSFDFSPQKKVYHFDEVFNLAQKWGAVNALQVVKEFERHGIEVTGYKK